MTIKNTKWTHEQADEHRIMRRTVGAALTEMIADHDTTAYT